MSGATNGGSIIGGSTIADPVLADLMTFLAESPSPYHAVVAAARRLDDSGWRELTESASWVGIGEGRFYVRRGGALVAWASPAGVQPSAPIRVIGAHTDSPTLRIKPRPDVSSAGWRQLGVEVYGGVLLNSWLDRDLGISGRVVRQDGSVELVCVDRPLLRVAQLAIHLDREVNERGVQLDKQSHLTPLWGLGEIDEGGFARFLAAEMSAESGAEGAPIAAWDLMVHDLTPPALLGRDRELLAAGRLDNLCGCHSALAALIRSAAVAEDVVPLAALFDHEEVGSGSTTGAAGPLLEAVLRRRCFAIGGNDDDLARSLAASSCVSVDMAHAVHPNYADRHEPGHRPIPNGGPVVKVNASQRYATDALSEAAFRSACERGAVPHQVFVSRNNMPCGSTIGPLTATRLGIATVDVGCAQLSMHSARELMGAADPAMLVSALTEMVSR